MAMWSNMWQNWQDGSSKCDGCPGQEAPYPLCFGNRSSDIMMVGQEPAYNVDEDRVERDMPWMEAQEQMVIDRRESMNPLWRHMMRLGLELEMAPDDLYFTNIAKCNPGSVEHCRGYIPRELANVNPRVLLLYGSNAIMSVFDMFDIEWSGSVTDVHLEPVDRSHLTIIPTLHWGYAMRNGTFDQYNTEVAQTVNDEYNNS